MPLAVRLATPADVPGIQAAGAAVYPTYPPYEAEVLEELLGRFPTGQFVAVDGARVVGYCAAIRVAAAKVFKPHSWHAITGGGSGSTHDPRGNVLYGVEIFVDPAYRGRRIADRFYRERRRLCRALGLDAIAFGARMPLLKKTLAQLGSIERYFDAVRRRRIKDPVLSTQLRNGFDIRGVLWHYAPGDEPSLGHAALMACPGGRAAALDRAQPAL